MRTAKDQLLDELASSLRGPRRARRRLLAEIDEDFEDALRAERAAGLSARSAEAEVLARFGCPDDMAERWNGDQAERRGAIRRNAVLVVLAAVIAGALGVTQYATGTNSPVPRSKCIQTGENSARARAETDACRASAGFAD